MTRKKVKLAFIANDSSRKATFKKRKKGLIKKVNELSTLCGINACAIIYSPYDTNPEVWPSNSGVQRIISDFRKLPEMDQNKKMVDQEAFLRQRIAKASENLKKQRKDNREMEMTEVMFQCLVGNMGMFNLNIMDLNDLGYMIDQYLKDVNRRIEILGSSGGGMEIGETSNDAAAAPSEAAGTLAIVPTTTDTIQPYHHQQQHQMFRHHAAPHVGPYEQPLNLNLSHSQNQQQGFTEMMMNRPEQMSYAAEQMGFPFMNDNHHHHHYHHHQQVPGESSTTPATNVSASSANPVTSSNPTNHIWFR
ncbi:agamous-like MADS-box protein AGL80 [Brassica napus]|uniref:agamous-like MADS-box protein AGL80 n=1 Tax=Brassica napus TaxID=3708 RepID=UPI002078EDA8|nr:agamous-like MADS-box protein AGL80 [Brassica napus]